MSGSVSLIDGHIDEVQVCPICGKEFAPKYARVYCSRECAKVAKKHYELEYKKRNAQKLKERRIARALEDKIKSTKKRSAIDDLSGEELLHYGAMQLKKNADLLRVEILDGKDGA